MKIAKLSLLMLLGAITLAVPVVFTAKAQGSVSLPNLSTFKIKIASEDKVDDRLLRLGNIQLRPTSTATSTKPAYDVPCIQTAQTKYSAAIIAAYDAHSASVKTALQKRSDEVNAALALSTNRERVKAFNAAFKNYRTAVNTAKKTFTTARQTAWKTFRTEAKACKNAPVNSLMSLSTSELGI